MGIEFGRLPDEMERALTAADFWELTAFFKLRKEDEDKAREKSKREAGRGNRR